MSDEKRTDASFGEEASINDFEINGDIVSNVNNLDSDRKQNSGAPFEDISTLVSMQELNGAKPDTSPYEDISTVENESEMNAENTVASSYENLISDLDGEELDLEEVKLAQKLEVVDQEEYDPISGADLEVDKLVFEFEISDEASIESILDYDLDLENDDADLENDDADLENDEVRFNSYNGEASELVDVDEADDDDLELEINELRDEIEPTVVMRTKIADLESKPRRVAAIDCGTNSIRLLIADVNNGIVTEVLREMRIVRLGEGIDKSGRFSPEAIERTLTAVNEFAELIGNYEIDAIRFCATSATRDAKNRKHLIIAVRNILGLEIEVITGELEAQLAFAGAVGDLSKTYPGPFLVVDIGGGSTEFVFGLDAVQKAKSVNVGCVRMRERHLKQQPPTPISLQNAIADIDAAIAQAARTVPLKDAKTLIAVAGTATTVAAASLELATYDRVAIHGAHIPANKVYEIAQRFALSVTPEIAALGFMHEGRVDVITAGALVLSRVMVATGADSFIASERDNLDGIALSIPQMWDQVQQEKADAIARAEEEALQIAILAQEQEQRELEEKERRVREQERRDNKARAKQERREARYAQKNNAKIDENSNPLQNSDEHNDEAQKPKPSTFLQNPNAQIFLKTLQSSVNSDPKASNANLYDKDSDVDVLVVQAGTGNDRSESNLTAQEKFNLQVEQIANNYKEVEINDKLEIQEPEEIESSSEYIRKIMENED